MEVYLNKIEGIADAICTMFISKRNLNREKEEELRNLVSQVLDENGFIRNDVDADVFTAFIKQFETMLKIGHKHVTLLRFIDLSVSVYGLHRGGTDDFDSHAKRLENRIVRSSTRLADYSADEVSEYYQDKIVPTDVALAYLGIAKPETLIYKGHTYIKAENGYILKGMEDNKDVKRGLYMLSLPMNFIFKVNLTELAHIAKMRGERGTANPEVKAMMEKLLNILEEKIPMLNRDFVYSIDN